MIRLIRYQGAIIRDHKILLIKHREHASGREYWVIPGEGREQNETEEACVIREMREETRLDVKIERLLLDEVDIPQSVYKRQKTYLCTIVAGEDQPGYELESEAAQQYAISEVHWFDLKDPIGLEAELGKEAFTFPLVQRIRLTLGYSFHSDR
jgi:8-oxo-dGTP diphosphatase